MGKWGLGIVVVIIAITTIFVVPLVSNLLGVKAARTTGVSKIIAALSKQSLQSSCTAYDDAAGFPDGRKA